MTADRVLNMGSVLVEVIDAAGVCRSARRFANLVVDGGLAWIASRMVAAPAAMSHMAIGFNQTAVAAWNTGLYQEAARAPLESATQAGAVSTYVATFQPGTAIGQVAELGIFNAASGGTMLNRVAFPPQGKNSSDTVKVTWTVTQSV